MFQRQHRKGKSNSLRRDDGFLHGIGCACNGLRAWSHQKTRTRAPSAPVARARTSQRGSRARQYVARARDDAKAGPGIGKEMVDPVPNQRAMPMSFMPYA